MFLPFIAVLICFCLYCCILCKAKWWSLNTPFSWRSTSSWRNWNHKTYNSLGFECKKHKKLLKWQTPKQTSLLQKFLLILEMFALDNVRLIEKFHKNWSKLTNSYPAWGVFPKGHDEVMELDKSLSYTIEQVLTALPFTFQI